jgi:hypothetical protein
MGDIGDDFRELREASKARRAANRELSTEMLKTAGVRFQVSNGGAHLIVDGVVDFWPGTGRFIHRTTKASGRGVRNMLKTIGRTIP